LQEAKTLSEEQVTRISLRGSEIDQVAQLLDEVVCLSVDDQERFVNLFQMPVHQMKYTSFADLMERVY
jgi:hypothetical protein